MSERTFATLSGKYPLTVRRKDANMCSHGEQTDELLDLIAELIPWLRAGTFDAEPEEETRDRARAVLTRYRPAT